MGYPPSRCGWDIRPPFLIFFRFLVRELSHPRIVISPFVQLKTKGYIMKTKILTLAALASLPFAAFAGSSCGSSCGSSEKASMVTYQKASYSAKADIVDTAVAAGSFNTLVAAVQAAGLVDTLKGDGPFTVFAPTDAAFAALPAGTVESLLLPENKDQLVAILTYHVVPAKVLAKDVAAGEAPTVNGQTVTIAITDGGVTVEGANVIQTDVLASNGVIHVIDQVIIPGDA
jgi:uncharacterized surface protein with fasciclin (FAS1) repeats